MGVVNSIDYESFPKQGKLVGKVVHVCFKYDTTHEIRGACVRDDVEEPFVTIFVLSDGRYVLATECQYRYE